MNDLLHAPLKELLPLLLTIIPILLMVATLWLTHWLMLHRKRDIGADALLPRQLIMVLLTILAVFMTLMIIPMSEVARQRILSLTGLILTGIVAFSSTTLVNNAMSGIMLRFMKIFTLGDFIQIDGAYGRVTERGLLHTEIQLKDSRLKSYPNAFLTANPVSVIRSDKTLINATVSLGYDLPHEKIEQLLTAAAEDSGLKEPFVLITALGDFSVSYQVSGLLTRVTELVTAEARLNRSILSVFRDARVEIVSPTFMNQRQLAANQPVIPCEYETHEVKQEIEDENNLDGADTIMFDKGEQASNLQTMKNELERLGTQRKTYEEAIKKTDSEREQKELDHHLEIINKRIENIKRVISELKKTD